MEYVIPAIKDAYFLWAIEDENGNITGFLRDVIIGWKIEDDIVTPITTEGVNVMDGDNFIQIGNFFSNLSAAFDNEKDTIDYLNQNRRGIK